MERSRLTVVVPTRNERERLGGLLETLAAYPSVQVVVADGESPDGTAEMARSAGVDTVSVPPGRARQMNAGAALARGKALLFLHADTRPPPGFDRMVRDALEGGAVGGAFAFSLDAGTPFLRLIVRTTNFRSRHMGVVFGDQGIFADRGIFCEVGGFPDQPIMEDHEFVRRLRRRGKFRLLEEAVITSARRWERTGALRNSLANVIITWAYVLGVPPERLKRWHRVLIGGGEER